MAKHYDKQFKLDAVQYYHNHRELGLQGCASNLGISCRRPPLVADEVTFDGQSGPL